MKATITGQNEIPKLTGAMFASPVIAPWPRTTSDGTMVSVSPPSTRKGTSAANFRGNSDAKEGTDTVAQILVSFPTFPHLPHEKSQAWNHPEWYMNRTSVSHQ